MKIFFGVLLFICTLFSCESFETEEVSNTHQVLSLLLDEFGSPVKPPPPIEGQKPYFTNQQIDSIMNQKQVLGVHRLLKYRKINKNLLEGNQNEDYVSLLENFNSFKSHFTFDINKIKSEKNYNIIYLDTLLSKQKQHELYDWQLFFSRIAFADNFEKALITVSIKHNGNFLCLLRKKNKKWTLVNTKMISIY